MVKRFARQNRTTRSSRRSWTGRAFAALLACALGAALAVGPVGCVGGEPDGADVPTTTATSSFTAMDTGMTLTVHAVSQAVADDAANACRQRVLELDELLAPENATSEIARINARPSQLEAARAAARRPEDAPLAILLAAHPYLAHDAFMGGALTDLLESMNAVVLFADEADRERSLQASFDFSDTLPWIVNREIIGAITQLHHRVDGIVLVSAFPCGPDSMTDDAIVRCIQGKPVLNLTIDAQSGTAGLETRVESFIDILRYQKKGGYVGA